MSTKLKSVLTVGALIAAAGGVAIFVGAGAASAQGTAPAWAPGGVSQDPNAVGGITFYNTAGQPITSGSTTATPFAAYAQGRTITRVVSPVDTKATLFGYVPQVAAAPDTWTTSEQIGLATTFPNAAAPTAGSPAPLNTSTLPVNTGAASDESLDTLAGDIPNSSTTAGYQGVYEIRMYPSGSHGVSATYDYADISIDSTAHTWSLVFTPGATATGTVMSTPSPSPTDTATSTTLTATESPAAAGTMQFFNGATAIGSPVAVNATTGVASTTNTFTTVGSAKIAAVFTPTDTTSFAGSTSASVLLNVTSPKIHTAAVTAVSGGYTSAGTDATVTVTVTDADGSAPAGSVVLTDNGAAIPGISAPVVTNNTTPAVNEVFTYDVPAPTGFAAGSHAVSAVFTPSGSAFSVSPQSNIVTFGTTTPVQGACQVTPTNCIDVQGIKGSIPDGTIIITTPYTAAAPLDLGTLTLAQDPTSGSLQFSASAPFTNIKIVDTRAGDLPYTVMAQSSDLSDGSGHANGVIDSQNVGLTLISGVGSGGFAGHATAQDNPAANPAVAPGAALGAAGDQGLGLVPHTVGGVDHGAGTFTFSGTLTLNAPSSTEPSDGLAYTGTITFTVG